MEDLIRHLIVPRLTIQLDWKRNQRRGIGKGGMLRETSLSS